MKKLKLKERGKLTIAICACVVACFVFGNYWTALVVALIGSTGMIGGAIYE